MSKPLTESVLRRLTAEAFISFLSESEKFEAISHPGCTMALCNEPVADLNGIIVGRGASEEHFTGVCRTCLTRELPFLAIVFPEAGEQIKEVAAGLGLVHAVDFPFMVREDSPIEPGGSDTVVVERVSGTEAAMESARVLCGAFNMPEDSVRRAMPPSFLESPGVDVFLARLDGRAVGSVTLTHHGDTTGIWAMGTDPSRQKGGIGRRLLSTAIAEARSEGARRCFLGATPAGYRLYESLGFETRVTATVWVSGETGQA
jgi:GNAT superfamily N-acetyltransferase